MQLLPTEILSQARAEKMKELDSNLKEFIKGSVIGEKVLCPVCKYSSGKNKSSAVIFKDAIKCFSCGIWRKI